MQFTKKKRDVVIDIEEGIALVGDLETYLSIVADYMQLTAITVQELQAAWASGDLDLLKLKAHSVKGAAGNLCIHRMKNVSAELETAARERKEDAIPQLIQQTQAEFAALQEYLRESVPEFKP